MNFQADPFATLLPADIVGAGRTIGDTPTVYEAVVHAYGGCLRSSMPVSAALATQPCD